MSTSRLRNKEFVPFAPDSPGQVRINHETDDCSGSSKSMQIERKEDGYVTAYCHRCGKSGRYRDAHARASARSSTPSRDEGDDEIRVRSSHGKPSVRVSFAKGDEVFANWPREVREWLGRYELGRKQVEEYGLVYNHSDNLLVFPCNDFKGRTTGYSARNFNPFGSKWYTDSLTDNHPYLYTGPLTFPPSIVLVEDPVSAIKIAMASREAVCLFGVHLHDNVFEQIKYYDTAFVWLDDDNQQVRKQQVVLRNKLELVIPEVRVIRTKGKDPKEHTTQEIRRLVD